MAFVASDEILKRIDEHIAQANQHMARGNELMDEIRREHQLNRAAFAENARVMAQLSQVLTRFDRSLEALVARIEDQGDAIRANTKAVLRLLDRFGGGAGPAAA